MTSLYKIDYYHNKDVIINFINTFEINETEAELIFNETKKWLWLCANNKKERQLDNNNSTILFIHQPLVIIDEMWHSFLLFTYDYDFFCKEYLGIFVHHRPWFNKNNPLTEDDLVSQMSYIYDYLGEDTLILWYKIFSKKYSYDIIRTLRR